MVKKRFPFGQIFQKAGFEKNKVMSISGKASRTILYVFASPLGIFIFSNIWSNFPSWAYAYIINDLNFWSHDLCTDFVYGNFLRTVKDMLACRTVHWHANVFYLVEVRSTPPLY